MQKPSQYEVFTTAYQDLQNVWRAMRGFVLTTYLILVAFLIARGMLPSIIPNRYAAALAIVLLGVVSLYFVAPYFVAVHRFILFGEVTRNYSFGADPRRLRKFFLWMILFSFFENVQIYAPVVIQSLSPYRELLGILVWINIGQFALLLFLPRLLLLFPATAADAAGVSLENAWRDTRGATFFIFFAKLLVIVPVFAIYLPIHYALEGSLSLTGNKFITGIIGDVFGLVALTLIAVVATRCFMAFSDRLNQPPAQQEYMRW